MSQLQQILPQVKALALEVGAFIRKEGASFSREKIELKGFNDLVSYVDKEAEKMLVEGLTPLVPGAGFVAEEGTTTHRAEEYNWIVDPLDGTTNFMHGLPIFAVSIALMQYNEVVLAVVYEVNKDECFYATKDSPAMCNDRAIRVSETPTLSESLLATGFPYYNFDKMPEYLTIINDFMRSTHGLRRMGSAAVDLVYVACGRFEGFFEYNLNPWDVAGGALIVKQAGGIVTDFSGGNNFVFGREIIAGNAQQAEMRAVIQRHWTGLELNQ